MLTKHRLSRFLLAGAYNTVVGYLIFLAIAIPFGGRLHHQAILVIAFTLSVVHAYFVQRYFVFRSLESMSREFARFGTANVSVLIVNSLLLEFFVVAGLSIVLAQLLATVMTTGIAFFAHSFWSFRKK